MAPTILDKFPVQNYDEAAALAKELLAGGAATVRELIAAVGDEFGDPAGAKGKLALHGLAAFATRPGGDADRKVVAQTLAAELDAKHSDELKAFLCRQLQLCGRTEEVAALAKLLTSDRLCEPATQALVAIGGPAAEKALQVALGDASGKRETTIRQAVDVLSKA